VRVHRPRSLALRGLHLFVLSGFALAQPLFDLLGRTPEFFVARGSTSWDVVALGLGLALLPALLLLGAEALAGLAHPRAQDTLHLAFVAGLIALVALQALRRMGDAPGWPLVAAALAAGALATVGYARLAPLRTVVTALAPAPLLFLVLFFVHSPIEALRLESVTQAGSLPVVKSQTPVVLIVFDEFPTTSIMDAEGHVDAKRFPNFGALAEDATWFRYATTVLEYTSDAVPAILDGQNPKPGALPLLADHPHNVFTYLAKSYRMHVLEPVTQLCPSDICERARPPFSERMRSLGSDLRVVYLHLTLPERLAGGLPPIDDTWQNFGEDQKAEDLGDAPPPAVGGKQRAGEGLARALWHDQRYQFEQWASGIHADSGQRPTFHFIHALVPHRPWRYMPDGKQYGNAAATDGLERDVWGSNQWLVTQAYQRHLLQVGFSDHLLGLAIQRLKKTGLYDRSLIVVVADHGGSFRPGDHRRAVTPTNIADIAPVPLFVKPPGQTRGKIDDRSVRTIDVLPTIADVLGTPLPWPVDGRSAFDHSAADRSAVTIYEPPGKPLSAASAAVAAGISEALARKVRIFGTGDWRRVFAIGPHAELVGRSLRSLPVIASSDSRAVVDGEPILRDLDLSSALAPSHITGQISGTGAAGAQDLAIAVNGTIAAVTRTVEIGGSTRFSVMAPESAFHQGQNSVEVFAVKSSAGRIELERLHGGGSGARLETLATGTEIHFDAGRTIKVTPDALKGAVESWFFEPDTARFVGWAADVSHHALSERILVFLDGRLAYAATTSFPRPDVVATYGLPKGAGFSFQLPLDLVGRGGAKLRFFALRGESASELSYPAGFPWR
jgi:hypothetical protein